MKYVTALPELEALFGPVGEASVRKEVPTIHPAYRAWIEVALSQGRAMSPNNEKPASSGG